MKLFWTIVLSCALSGWWCAALSQTPLFDKVNTVSPYIYCLFEDQSGTVWIGDRTGLRRLNGSQVTSFSEGDQNMALHGMHVQAINQLDDGRLLVGTRKGVNVLDFQTAQIDLIQAPCTDQQEVRKIIIDGENIYWATYGGGLVAHNLTTGASTCFLHDSLDNHSIPGNFVNDLLLDQQGRLWVGTEVGGLALFNKSSGQFQRIALDDASQYTVSALHQDKDGAIWVGTWANGLYQWKEREQELHRQIDFPWSNVNAILSHQKSLWLGSLNGLVRMKDGAFDTYQADANRPNALIGNDVWTLMADKEDILWVGCLTSGLCQWDAQRHKITDLKLNVELPSEEVNVLYQHKDDQIWVGFKNQGLQSFDPATGIVSPIPTLSKLKGVNVQHVQSDDGQQFWISTDNGLYHYNALRGTVNNVNLARGGATTQQPGAIFSSSQDAADRIYATGWGTGLATIELEGDQYHHHLLTSANSALKSDVSWQALTDQNGLIWMATNEGVVIFDPQSQSFLASNIPDTYLRLAKDSKGHIWGLQANGQVDKSNGTTFEPYFALDQNGQSFSQIMVDDQGWLWVMGSSALYRISPTDPTHFQTFDQSTGLNPAHEVSQVVTMPNGTVLLGTTHGIKISTLDQLSPHPFVPQIGLMNCTLNDDSLIQFTPFTGPVANLDLPYGQHRLEFRLTANNYSTASQGHFLYKMESEAHWHQALATHPNALFSGLSRGNHRLIAKYINADGVSGPEAVLANVQIRAPWWWSWWAWVLYVIGTTLLIRAGLTYSLISLKRKNQMEMQENEARRQQELTEAKMSFFTNVSHEFKTPLTLILGPVQQLQSEVESAAIKAKLAGVARNAEHLNQLVSELLEFRRMETGAGQLNSAVCDLSIMINSAVRAYQELAQLRNVELKVDVPQQALVDGDQHKLQRVLQNLLSNAFKFTQENGTISIRLTITGIQCQLYVEDSGPGIRHDLMDKIFDRFVGDLSHPENAGGTGIGLSLVRQIVQLHEGNVIAENLEQGARFIVTLPVGDVSDGIGTAATITDTTSETAEGRPTLLIVEDNMEIRQFTASLLQSDFQLYMAENGEEGLALAKQYQPDVILSDIMMPVMNGLDMCKALKNDISTSHIPVILLTAKTDQSDIISGLEHQADDYITKPFDSRVLRLKLNNLLDAQRKWRSRFIVNNQTQVNPHDFTSVDEQLVDRVVKCIIDQMDNSDLSVQQLANEVGMHRSNLARKLPELTGFSPVEFIRHIRLTRAMELLKTGKFSISDVAYHVGFSNPKYFSTVFKQQFGQTPTQMVEQVQTAD